jgi:hypothetical protein
LKMRHEACSPEQRDVAVAGYAGGLEAAWHAGFVVAHGVLWRSEREAGPSATRALALWCLCQHGCRLRTGGKSSLHAVAFARLVT